MGLGGLDQVLFLYPDGTVTALAEAAFVQPYALLLASSRTLLSFGACDATTTYLCPANLTLRQT